MVSCSGGFDWSLLHAENDQDVIIFMRGRLAKLMTMIAPQTYQKYITVKTAKSVICQGKKGMHGMLKSALLFDKEFRGNLELIGFEVNPYDPCVANKIINGNQMTIV